MNRLRSKLTYANVVASLALFVALAGSTAFAATQMLPKNSVGERQLRKNSVSGSKIKNGAVTGAKIDLQTLGTVPSAANATHASSADHAVAADHAVSADHSASADRATAASTADNAQALQGSSAAQIEGASKLACPTGTREVAGLCFENTPRAALPYTEAIEECACAERVLASMSEMKTFDLATKNLGSAEWSGQIYYDGTQLRAETVSQVTTSGELISSPHPYRCAVPPSN